MPRWYNVNLLIIILDGVFCERRFWKLRKIVLCLHSQLIIWLRYEKTYKKGGGNNELVLG